MNISAKIVAHSISPDQKEIITFELEYPRFIHSEFMTHRVFSRNSASSRAIPTKKLISQVWNNPAMPIEFGSNKAGMQAGSPLTGLREKLARTLWVTSAKVSCLFAYTLWKFNVHKQVVNRVLEPFQYMKVVMTTTELESFFHLRLHKDAQPEIHRLARCMLDEVNKSTPRLLLEGDWHVPYYKDGLACKDNDVEPALKISASCCAQVSYRATDNSLLKAEKIYDKLVNSEPIHASPFEHQARPIKGYKDGALCTDEGITGLNKNNEATSGNFTGWVQYRQLL